MKSPSVEGKHNFPLGRKHISVVLATLKLSINPFEKPLTILETIHLELDFNHPNCKVKIPKLLIVRSCIT